MSVPNVLPSNPPVRPMDFPSAAQDPPGLRLARPTDLPSRPAAPPLAPAEATGPGPRLSAPERQQLVTELNLRLAPVALRLQIQIDDQTGTPVIRLVDSDSGEVLRQIPDEAKLKLAQVLADQLQGQLIDQNH